MAMTFVVVGLHRPNHKVGVHCQDESERGCCLKIGGAKPGADGQVSHSRRGKNRTWSYLANGRVRSVGLSLTSGRLERVAPMGSGKPKRWKKREWKTRELNMQVRRRARSGAGGMRLGVRKAE